MSKEIITLNYRLPSTQDFYSLEQLGDFYSKCFKAEYAQYLSDDDMAKVSAWSGESLAKDMVAIDHTDTVTIACFCESSLLGTAIYAERQGTVYVWGMYVHPDRLREGIGRSLISEIAQSVSPESSLEVSVIKESTKAMDFYKTLGFRAYSAEEAEVFPKVVLSLVSMECAIQNYAKYYR